MKENMSSIMALKFKLKLKSFWHKVLQKLVISAWKLFIENHIKSTTKINYIVHIINVKTDWSIIHKKCISGKKDYENCVLFLRLENYSSEIISNLFTVCLKLTFSEWGSLERENKFLIFTAKRWFSDNLRDIEMDFLLLFTCSIQVCKFYVV